MSKWSNPKNLRIIKDLFINGKFVKAQKGQTFSTFDPSTEQTIAEVQRATNEDVDIAVKAARQAFDHGPWTRMDPSDRATRMFKLTELITQNLEQLASLESYNNGKPFAISKMADVPFMGLNFRYNAGWIDKIRGHTLNIDGPFFAYTRKQPVGVVGAVIPWNFPLIMFGMKIAPILAAGCTVVLKTSENTPLSALRMGELIAQAGIPPGVVNILSGYGDVGSYLAKHPGVDKVTFTGSTKVGFDLMRNSHEKNLKRITLELGGKSANIITKSADLQASIHQSAFATMINAGQCCIAGTRTFVHESLYDQYLQKIVQNVKTIKVGNPFDEETGQGPLINRKQMEKVLQYIQKGKSEGAKLIAGGKRIGNKGYFVEPTVFCDVKDNMTIAREQIFGPVMSIFKFKTNQQALERANASNYGLAAGVMSSDPSEIMYFTQKLKAGTVYANSFAVFGLSTPFGGYKDSGIGREMGEEGLHTYLQTKTVIIKK